MLKLLDSGKADRIPQEEEIAKIIRFTGFALGREFAGKSTCLKRSLLLYHFLRRAGVDVVVHFGIKREVNGLIGHSWLTIGGEPYRESREHLSDFEAIYCFGVKR